MLKKTLALACLSVSSIAANAAVISLSGDIFGIAPPPSSATEALESSDYLFFWTEHIGVTTTVAINVSIIPGVGVDKPTSNPTLQLDGSLFYDSGDQTVENGWAGDLAAGTYDSYFVHGDKQGTNVTFNATLVFDQEIVAIIYNQTQLCDTDGPDQLGPFGAVGTTYADCSTNRTLELDGDANWIHLSADRMTLEINTVVAHNMDDIRIITTSAVPVPAAAWLFGSALIGLAGIKRK